MSSRGLALQRTQVFEQIRHPLTQSRYLGAAASLADKDYLTAAGSILASKARHTSYLRAALGESPFSNPFDTPLDFVRLWWSPCWLRGLTKPECSELADDPVRHATIARASSCTAAVPGFSNPVISLLFVLLRVSF